MGNEGRGMGRVGLWLTVLVVEGWHSLRAILQGIGASLALGHIARGVELRGIVEGLPVVARLVGCCTSLK